MNFQAGVKKDVVLSDKSPTNLLLDKHITFLASYGQDKKEYVSVIH